MSFFLTGKITPFVKHNQIYILENVADFYFLNFVSTHINDNFTENIRNITRSITRA